MFRVELRDRDLEFVKILDSRILDPRWGFSPIGGCSEFSFNAPSKYCTELDLGGNFNVQILKKDKITGVYGLVYQGRIENVKTKVKQGNEEITVQGFGYQSELKDIIPGSISYSSQEISVVVKDVLDSYIVPNTNITYDSGDIEATGFTPDTLTFEYTDCQEILRTLAEIAGGIEWGVDKNRKLYFKARSTESGFFYGIGNKLISFDIESSSREILNHIVVLGGDVSGSKFIYTKDYTKNQAKYKRRDGVIQNSAVTTNVVAEQLADARQAEKNGIVDRGSAILRDDIIIEDTIPVKLFEVKTREVLYDEKEYDTFLYAGQDAFRIGKIGYVVKNNQLEINLSLGDTLPNITEDIKRLKFEIDQLTQRS